MSNQSTAQPPRPKPRHLIDFDAPRPVRNRQAEERSLTRVQQWVMSTLAVTTILHFSGGLLLAANYESTTSGRVVLSVIAGAFGVIAVAAGLAIHRKRVLSPWLLLGTLPTILGIWLLVL